MLFDTEFVTYHGDYKIVQTDKLNIPTKDGRRTILSNHMPIMIPIDMGVIETNNNGVLSHFVVSEGILYFKDNHAKIVCDVIEDIETVDLDYYEQRLSDAKKELEQARTDVDIKKANIQLARATNIIKAAGKNHK